MSLKVGMRWIYQQNHTIVTATATEEYDLEDLIGVFSFVLTDAEMTSLSAVNYTEY
jgi:diketogulonate reductase-like aldo/keto reductase